MHEWRVVCLTFRMPRHLSMLTTLGNGISLYIKSTLATLCYVLQCFLKEVKVYDAYIQPSRENHL